MQKRLSCCNLQTEGMTTNTNASNEITGIDHETQVHIKSYVEQHNDFLQRTLKFGSPLQKAKAHLFLHLAEGIQ